jgi:hypothetical protein
MFEALIPVYYLQLSRNPWMPQYDILRFPSLDLKNPTK